MNTHHLDARGMKCPLPVLKARKLMKDLTNGDVLEVHATDPGAPASLAPSLAACIRPGPPPVMMSQPMSARAAATRFTSS